MAKPKKDAVQLTIDYKQTFGSEHGKRVLNHILESGHVFHTSFAPTPHETAFREGERNMALRILYQCEQDVEKVRHMIKQSQEGEEA